MNLFAVIDLTVPRLKRTLFLGTRWGEEGAKLVPAPGDPWYADLLVHAAQRRCRRLLRRRRPGRRRCPARRRSDARPDATRDGADTAGGAATHIAVAMSPVPPIPQVFAGPYPADARQPPPRGDRLMLTRFVRIQLIIFTIASVVGVSVMVVKYHAGADTSRHRPHHRDDGVACLRWPVPVRQRDLSGQAGRQGHGAQADPSPARKRRCRLDTSPKIPEDLAGVRAQCLGGGRAVCRPTPEHRRRARISSDGSVIAVQRTTLPQPIGPVLDRVRALVDSIPGDKLRRLCSMSLSRRSTAPDTTSDP